MELPAETMLPAAGHCRNLKFVTGSDPVSLSVSGDCWQYASAHSFLACLSHLAGWLERQAWSRTLLNARWDMLYLVGSLAATPPTA